MNTKTKQLNDKQTISTYMKRIQIVKNTKTPAFKWSNPKNHYETIDHKLYNDAILTGKINNLFVLDVDLKDGGLVEYNKYVQKFGEIDTFKQSTPNNGLHLFFKYTHHKPEVQYVIQNILTNKSKYRGVGLDIRTNGGYIMSAPSVINGKSYTITNDVDTSEIPESLVYWLIENVKPLVTQGKQVNKVQVSNTICNMTYDITEIELLKLLDELPSEYCDNFDLWYKVTDVLKNMGMYNVWNKWSMKSITYRKENNVSIWNGTGGILNINYLMTLLGKPLIPYMKPVPTTRYTPTKTDCKKYLSDCLAWEDFKKNETVIIKSCTGTGKTTAVAKYCEQYMMTNRKRLGVNALDASGTQSAQKYKVISITNLISLGRQHIESFKKFNINLTSYDSPEVDIKKDNIYVCINSLYKLFKDVHKSYFENCIVYIDEITTFIECLTHNDLLDKSLKDIYSLLIKIVKNCHKLIVSDATINQTTFDFVSHRKEYYYVVNEYKKFKDVPAMRYNDENTFYNQIKQCVKDDNYFLFGSDWNSRITDMYESICKEYPDKKDKMILITSDTKFKVGDASEQFKNKFVFYSPSITTAVDFSIDDKQDVFIYLSGKSILPTGTFQQTTRTRNISKLHYYADASTHSPQYKNYDELVLDYKEMTSTSYKLNDVCMCVDENDDEKMIENTFFKLYTYNEYLRDCYESNKNVHFKNILMENGFIITSEGTRKCLSKDVTDEFKEIRIDIEEKLFNEYISDRDRTVEKFSTIHERVGMLNITCDEDLKKYKSIIMNKYDMEKHMNIIRLMKDDEFVKFKIEDAMNGAYKVKTLTNIYSKINLINQIMKPNDISTILTSTNLNWKISDDKYQLIKKLFRVTRSKPTDADEYKKLVVSMINSLGDIIDSKRVNVQTFEGRVKETVYTLNESKIKEHISLDRLTNFKCTNYSKPIIEYFELTYGDAPEKNPFN